MRGYSARVPFGSIAAWSYAHMKSRPSALAALAVATLAMGACSSSTGRPAAKQSPHDASSSLAAGQHQSNQVGGAATSVSTAPSTAVAATHSAPIAKPTCLYSAAHVSVTLNGNWLQSGSNGTCSYSSDRGETFSVSPVDAPNGDLAAALAAARTKCVKPTDAAAVTKGAFACFVPARGSTPAREQGNLIAAGRLWLIDASVPRGASSQPQQYIVLGMLNSRES
jgi:hypothetical protein